MVVGWVVLEALPARAAEPDPPGVARVGLIDGSASYRLREGDDWTGVAVNAPLVTGDAFYSGEGSRAEIQLAPGTYARLGANTQIDLVELAPDATHVRIPIGTAILRLRRDPRDRHVEIGTPSVSVVVERAGSYRVDVDAQGRTTVRVARGEAVAHVGKERFDLYAHTTSVVDATHGVGTFQAGAHRRGDAFDAWDDDRDARIDAAQSYQHVSTDIYGVEDLDENGVWEYHRGYGQLWRPTTVEVGWAPYRDGRWVWVDPWGWTWLDYASWGWAPFHYGRWLRLSGSWYWGPGTVIANPVYAPALVGFYGYGVGYGSSVGVSIGLGGGFAGGYVGWTPLGWGEPCYPWWGGWGGVRVGSPWWGGWGGPRIVNNVYVNQKNIYNIGVRDVKHANRRHPGGFTAVRRDSFGRGGRVIPVRERDRGAFRPVGGRVGVSPDRSSRRAVEPSRAIVGRGAQPEGSSEREGMRRAARGAGADRVGRSRGGRGGGSRGGAEGRAELTASGGVSSGARAPVASRAQRAADRTSVVSRAGGRSDSRGDRTASDQGDAGRAAIGARSAARSTNARSAVASRSTNSGREALTARRSPTRGGLRTSVVPRPPARAERMSAPSAPRRHARRSEPYVATRPTFSASDSRGRSALSGPGSGPRTMRSAGLRASRSGSSSNRPGVGRSPGSSRLSASRSDSSEGPALGRAPSPSRGGGRRGGVSVSRSGASAVRSGSLRREDVGRSFAGRSGARATSPSRSSLRTASPTSRRSLSGPSRSTVRSPPRRSSGSGRSLSGPSRSSASVGRRSFSGGGGRGFSGGGRSLAGGRSIGGGSRGGGRVGIGRR